MVAMELVVLRQSFAKRYGGGEGVGRGRAAPGEGVRLPSPHYLLGEGEKGAGAELAEAHRVERSEKKKIQNFARYQNFEFYFSDPLQQD